MVTMMHESCVRILHFGITASDFETRLSALGSSVSFFNSSGIHTQLSPKVSFTKSTIQISVPINDILKCNFPDKREA